MSWRSVAGDCQPWAVNSHPPWGSSGESAERRAHPLAPPEHWGSRSASCRPALPRRVLGSRRPREAPGGSGFLPGSKGGGGGSPVEGGGREPRGFSRAQSPAPTPKAASQPHGLPRTSCLISFGQTFPGGAVLRGGHRGCLPPLSGFLDLQPWWPVGKGLIPSLPQARRYQGLRRHLQAGPWL